MKSESTIIIIMYIVISVTKDFISLSNHHKNLSVIKDLHHEGYLKILSKLHKP